MPSVTTMAGMREIGDDRALQRHYRDADDERREPGESDRRARDRERAADRRQNANQRADGNVDVAGNDHHRHADRGDRDIGVAEQDVGEIARGEKARIDEPDDDGKADDRDRQQRLLRGDGERADARATALAIAVALTPPSRVDVRPSSPRPTASDVASARVKFRDDAPLAHDQHAVAHAEHLGQFARDHQDRDALRRRVRSSSDGSRPWRRRRCRASAHRESAACGLLASHLPSTIFC